MESCAARLPQAYRQEEMNINKLRSVMAPRARNTWTPTAGRTSVQTYNRVHILAQKKTSAE